MRIGVIGTGTIGSLIVGAFINSKSVKPKNIYVMNRTREKALAVAEKFQGVNVCRSAEETIHSSDIIVICVKPLQFFPLLEPLRSLWHTDQLVISVTSPISVPQLEKLIPCQVARVIPSIVNEGLSGNTLVTFGTRMTDFQKFKLWNLLGNFSKPVEINEENIRVASDLSSCGPAFLSFFLEKMIDGAVETTSVSRKEASQLVTEMIIGFGRLLEDNSYSLPELRKKVTVEGGITGVGLNILEQAYHSEFNRLFAATQKKFIEDHQKVDPQFKVLDD
ncbi:late competence protein ComER [Sporolactobacillus sp. Y61]|jgi:competence protein ComER|uniref:Pyrroline-5-carboxylate reductase n=1 Tax=Sporolactobacillus sp. Y61 TaxID=3160863 RepID=A0AAU8IE30_9BACL